MTYEEVRAAALLAGGKARRPSWGGAYMQFVSSTRPSHTRLLRGSSPEALVSFVLSGDEVLAETGRSSDALGDPVSSKGLVRAIAELFVASRVFGPRGRHPLRREPELRRRDSLDDLTGVEGERALPRRTRRQGD